MSDSKDCDICFGTGVLIKTEEVPCPACNGTSSSSCSRCKGFGRVRQQVSEPCPYCPEGENKFVKTMSAPVEHTISRSRKKTKIAQEDMAMLMALTVAALVSLLMLKGSSNIPMVVTVFIVGFLTLQPLFKVALKRILS